MKKSNLLLLASALLLTTGCEAFNAGGIISSSSVSSTKSSFASYWLADVSISSASLNLSYRLDYSSTHAFYTSLNGGSKLFVRKNSGGVALLSLNEHNEVVSEDVLGKSFDSRFVNPIATWEMGQSVSEDCQKALMSLLFEEALGLKGTLTSFDVSSNSIGFNVNVGADVYAVSSSIIASSESNANASISPLEETASAKEIDSKLSKLQEGNFTLNVTKDGEAVKTILSLSDRMLIDGALGYLKDETGYKILDVSGSKVTQKGVSNNAYSSLTADFDVSGAIFDGASLNGLVNPSLIEPHFRLKEISQYLDGKLFKALNPNGDNFSISFYDASSTVVLSFTKIGSTVLPVDLSKITVEKTWKNQYPDIASIGEEYYGDDFDKLPYFFSISKWKIDGKSPSSKTLNLKLDCDSEAGEYSTSFVSAYISKVIKAGFNWYGATQINALDTFSIGGDGDETNDHFFECGRILVEVYDATNDQYVEENAVYIWLSPLGE